MVGDGQSPNVFFVTDQGVVVTITRSFETAHKEWKVLSERSPLVESALEDRKQGTICDVSPEDDGGKLIRRDDSGWFLKHHPQHRYQDY